MTSALAIGCRVRIHGLKSRPELNTQLGWIISIDEARGRVGVRIGDTVPEDISIKRSNLTREDRPPPWDTCRHGGPSPTHAMMESLNEFLMTSMTIIAPCLEHVKLLHPIAERAVNRGLKPIVLASMGVDAYCATDFPNCRSFAVSALVLEAARRLGGAGLAETLCSSGPDQTRSARELEASLAKCTSATGLREILGRFTRCDCLAEADARGVGLRQASIEPERSHVDVVFEEASPAEPVELPASEEAAPAGERLARLALQVLAQSGDERSATTDDTLAHQAVAVLAGVLCDDAPNGLGAQQRVLMLRHAHESLHESLPSSLTAPQPVGRAGVREGMLAVMQATAVAGLAFVEGGGVPLLQGRLESALPRLRAERAATRHGGAREAASSDDLLLALEALAGLQSPALATACLKSLAGLQSSIAALVCEIVPAANDLATAHNALRALWGILRNAAPSEWVPALAESALQPVITTCGAMFYDMLEQSMTDFSMLDIVCALVTLIAGGSAALCRLVATVAARGNRHVIPTSLCLILNHHAHEQRAGREDKRSPLGAQQHVGPINQALEGLYTLSLHFDVRDVRIGSGNGTQGLHEAIAEYADLCVPQESLTAAPFPPPRARRPVLRDAVMILRVHSLHGLVHHQAKSKYMQAYLKRLVAFTPRGHPPYDPRPRPIETEAEQQRRLVQYADSMQQARRQARRQRERTEAQCTEAVQRADAARALGNDAIRRRAHQEAADA